MGPKLPSGNGSQAAVCEVVGRCRVVTTGFLMKWLVPGRVLCHAASVLCRGGLYPRAQPLAKLWCGMPGRHAKRVPVICLYYCALVLCQILCQPIVVRHASVVRGSVYTCKWIRSQEAWLTPRDKKTSYQNEASLGLPVGRNLTRLINQPCSHNAAYLGDCFAFWYFCCTVGFLENSLMSSVPGLCSPAIVSRWAMVSSRLSTMGLAWVVQQHCSSALHLYMQVSTRLGAVSYKAYKAWGKGSLCTFWWCFK